MEMINKDSTTMHGVTVYQTGRNTITFEGISHRYLLLNSVDTCDNFIYNTFYAEITHEKNVRHGNTAFSNKTQ